MTAVEVLHQEGYRKLLATRDFHQGEVILYLPQTPLEGPNKYSIEITPGVHVDCSNSIAAAINHSCNPNASVRHGRIVAWSCIKVDEEITIDYKKTEQKLAVPFYCNCGYSHCKGIIE